jgi:hypothetical protein
MASGENTTEIETANLLVGKVAILYGNVKAVASDGTERVLAVNSPIFAHDRIMTGSDGMVSIVIDDATQTQIDIGRMSYVIIDEDIFAGISGAEATEAAAEVEQIQELLLAEGDTFDPTTELEAPAAGGVASAGGGHPVPVFDRITHEGEVTSGAETTGIGSDTVEPIEGVVEPDTEGASVTISSSGDVNEDAAGITFDIQVDQPPEGGSATAIVNINGVTYQVAIDADGNGSLFIATQDSDVYNDSQQVTATVTGVTGGNYEDVNVEGATDSANITDEGAIDTTTVTITSVGDVNEDAEGVTFNIQVDNPPQGGSATAHVDVDGVNYDVAIDAAGTGSLFIATQNSDVYNDSQQVTATVTGVTGGNYEDVNVEGATDSANITDEGAIDTITLELSTSDIDENTDSVTFTATLSQAAEGDVTVTTD